MRLAPFLLLVAASCSATGGPEAPTPAEALLERSLEYHDPDARWGREVVRVRWVSTRPGGETAYDFDLRIGPGGDLAMSGERRGWQLEYRVQDGVATSRVVGAEEVTPEMEQELLLGRDDGLFWRDYLGFLGGLPMVLAHDGVRIEPEVVEARLEERAVLALHASFDPGVGTDRWTFYFDPATAALVGCRFDKADPAKDGETIVFEGETTAGGVRLPCERRWYVNRDERFLGTDEITAR